MRALAPLLRSAVNIALTGRCQLLDPSFAAAKSLSTSAAATSKPDDDFARRIFENVDEGGFFRRLGKAQNAPHQRQPSPAAVVSEGGAEDGGSYNTLQDGMDQKLKNFAAVFDFIDGGETSTANKQDLGGFRPNPSLYPSSYNNSRNVRFLANFITEAGIIVKRSKTGISAKAQRKIAREIKTARAFGLLPFTTMGTKSFVFGQTMEEAAPVSNLPAYK
ncbi:unnamed protein product [Linum tenue]|uniref:Small ribosomal subunit protein bS18c n=1 Tax=Linum tenue TaxID=586396 RepID=A0AAV0M0W1_9ROSI|nr:unnamed protein product [Linum tenue]